MNALTGHRGSMITATPVLGSHPHFDGSLFSGGRALGCRSQQSF
jgi:hypothetical protein